MKNPYLDEYNKHKSTVNNHFVERIISYSKLRDSCIAKYGFAIPDDKSLQAIKSLNRPIIEMGAGSGYWAYLLDKMGVDIIAFDNFEGKYAFAMGKYSNWKDRLWFDVQLGSIEKIKEHPDRILFICWPDYDTSFASDCLKTYKGDIVVYVGESEHGCTGDGKFFKMLDKEFDEIGFVALNQWLGIHDNLFIYKRKRNVHDG